MILAGDIGGTNTRLALFEGEPGALKPIVIDVFPSGEHGGLEEIAEGFIAAYRPPLTRASFGIDGPIRNGVSGMPNLPWVINAAHVADRLKLKSVRLLNDLEANAYGIAELGVADLEVLTEGTPGQEGNQALISAGTGLGEAGLLFNGTAHQPFPSEGGHADFAPRNALEAELLTYLLHRYEHVSYERVLSGPGLRNI